MFIELFNRDSRIVHKENEENKGLVLAATDPKVFFLCIWWQQE